MSINQYLYMSLSAKATLFLNLANRYAANRYAANRYAANRYAASDMNDAAPELMALKQRPIKDSNLWFGDVYSRQNGDRYFAILDRAIIKALKNLDFVEEPAQYYLAHPKTKELIGFVCQSYDRYFPKLNSNVVYENLVNDGTLDADQAYELSNPIFILIHDLLHQVLQSDFVDSLHQQQERDNDSIYPNTTLLDEVNEDAASIMSNLKFDQVNAGQGLFAYIRRLFANYYGEYNKTDEEDQDLDAERLKQVIEKTFHYAKAELRGKVDTIAKDRHIVQQDTPAKTKQLLDGFLSKVKNHMLQNVQYALAWHPAPSTSSDALWKSFKLEPLIAEWFGMVAKSQLVDPADSSALRQWMMGCLREMKKLHDYFSYQLEDEFYQELEKEEEEDDTYGETSSENPISREGVSSGTLLARS